MSFADTKAPEISIVQVKPFDEPKVGDDSVNESLLIDEDHI